MSNPHRFNSALWRAYEQGKADTNDKWRAAVAGKLPAEKREARA